MSRPYSTDEQYERWHMAQCCRCGRRRNKAGSWPDGYVCRTCSDRAVQARGACPGCCQDRALPGRRSSDGAAICTTCAGFSQSFACTRCSFEDKLHRGRLCTRCTLADRLAELLDDGTGRIRPELVPLADSLLAMDKPRSGLSWLTRRGAATELLGRLGRGEIELTHEAFHTLQPWRAAAHLRELLMACGVLPAIDKQICSLERWLVDHLADITDPDHAQVVRRFATWEVLPRLRTRAETKPITPAGRRHAGDQIKHATAFLQWLCEHDLVLSTCRQVDIDTWHVEHNEHSRNTVRAFLQWCTASKLTRRFRLPAAVIRQAAPLPQHERVDLLGHLLTDHSLPLRPRVAAAIVLLYAQPLSRVVRLTIDDVIHDDDQVLLRLGQPPSPVPGPVATLLLDWIQNRNNMNTATNRDSRWLFPGRRAGQPMHSDTLAAQVNGLGIPTVAGRASAIRQHVLEMPASVVADALGYHQVTTAKLATQTAATWSRYAAGDHLQSPSGWTPQRTHDS
ncbi:hypothetical protein F1D05_03805 [Kribbella qitaiheensis]|uniref:Recombinase XerD n=2 Tax=Kribbella qitaiheensis TaxID=1544730 RepID=A0A7G6WT82_9ACTN|nr:hypothetical protein F1D05_03805 [Kribbella qitaiheensis]